MGRPLNGARLKAGDTLVEGLGHPGPLGRLVAHRRGQRRQALDLGRLVLGHLGLAGLVLGPGVDVLGVGPLVLDQHALVEVQDTGDRLVQQLDVVADDEQGAPVGPQETHEPGLGVAVEVVGRLVEEQDVAAGKKDAGQLEAPALAAREHADGQVEAVAGQPQPGDELADLGLARVPTGGREALLGPRVTVDGPLGRVVLHGRPELLEADRGLVQAPARQDVGQPAGLHLRGQPAAGPGSGNPSAPTVSTLPPAGGSSPLKTLSRLVLPAPLRPTRPTLSPARTLNEASARVRRPRLRRSGCGQRAPFHDRRPEGPSRQTFAQRMRCPAWRLNCAAQ